MSSPGKTPKHVKLDERNHVENSLLDQLASLGWEVVDLTDMKQTPADTHRDSFTERVITHVLRERLKVIKPWLEDDHIEEVVKQLTASFPSTGLLENNKHLFQLLLENTSVSENHLNGEKARPSALQTLRPTTTTASARSASSRSASSAPSTTSPRHRAIPQRPPRSSDRVQIAQGKGRDSRGHRPVPPLQRAARGQEERECAALLLLPVRRGDLPSGSQVRHHHDAHGVVLLSLGRPACKKPGRAGPRLRQPQRPAASRRRHARPEQPARPDSDLHAVLAE